jgi:hypothetical protein
MEIILGIIFAPVIIRFLINENRRIGGFTITKKKRRRGRRRRRW